MKVFDLHCDTLSELRYAEKAGTPKSFAQNDLHIDLQKLKKGDYMLQCFAAFVNLGDKTPGSPMFAYFLRVPPSTLMHISSFAPELSATFR